MASEITVPTGLPREKVITSNHPLPAMYATLLELLAGLLPYVGYGLASLGLTVLGLLVEYSALQTLTTGGDMVLGLWLEGIGLLLLYAGLYLVGYGKLVSRVRERRAAEA